MPGPAGAGLQAFFQVLDAFQDYLVLPGVDMKGIQVTLEVFQLFPFPFSGIMIIGNHRVNPPG
jgi:hypothetical protein